MGFVSKPVNAFAAASEQTRASLLESGLRLLATLPASAAFGHLTANKIAAEAGRTTGAFFHQWPTMDAYLVDFVAYVLDPKRGTTTQSIVERLSRSLSGGKSFAEAMTEAGLGTPMETAQDSQTVVELLMWNRAMHDADFRDSVASNYTAMDTAAATVYEQLMAILGREPRPPFTAATIASVVSSVAQGLALRASLTPGHYPDEVFGWVVLGLIPLLTREVGDGSDAADYVESLPLRVTPEEADDGLNT